MNLTLKQLEAFIWVADLGSFRKAAERLNTTQPNISTRISSLESALNVQVLERDAGSVTLTARGQLLLEHARTIIRQTETLIDASQNTALYDGTLRLGVTELIAHTWLRQFLRELNTVYPNVVVELTVDLSVNLKKTLFDHTIDLAFQNGPFNRTTSGSVDLGSYPWIWVASPELSALSGESISLQQLAQNTILTHSRDTQVFAELQEHFRAGGAMSPRLVPSSSLAACLHMTLGNMGVATVPSCMVQAELERGELYQLNYDWVPDSLHFLARYDSDKASVHVAKAAQLAQTIARQYTPSL